MMCWEGSCYGLRPTMILTFKFGTILSNQEEAIMRSKLVRALLVAASSIPIVGCTCVDFDPPLQLGASYGGPPYGQVPGSVIFTKNGISVSVRKFFTPSTHFGVARIEKRPGLFGNSQVVRSNNIGLGFDFSGVGFTPSVVSYGFVDMGGIENISVNSSAPFVGRLSSFPPSIGPANISVSKTQIPGGSRGSVTLYGQVKRLVVGGQELWIDRVCAQRG